MIRNFISTLCFCASLTIGALLSPAYAEDSCQPVFDALTKVVSTPSHGYHTSTAAYQDHGQPRESEIIYLDEKIFMRVKGQWTLSKATPAEILEQEKENRQNAKMNCQAVRSDSVNGEAVTVYSIHTETEDAKEAGQLWISKSTGRLLREEQDVDLGGSDGKTHRSSRFEYSNVRAPM
jgi:hypothetical protein